MSAQRPSILAQCLRSQAAATGPAAMPEVVQPERTGAADAHADHVPAVEAGWITRLIMRYRNNAPNGPQP